MSRKLHPCECGCGKEAYWNQLTEVVVEEAIDETLRQTQTKKRFFVLRQCKVAFEEELACMTHLQIIVRFWGGVALQRKTALQRLNLIRTFILWWKRIGAAVKVMKLQHAIYERTRGFEYARTRATQSAILFAAPRFSQGLLAKMFLRRAQKKAANAANSTTTTVVKS